MSIDLGKSVKLKGNFLSERKLCRIVAVFIVAVFVAVQFSFVVFVGEADACSDALRAKNTRISDSSSTGTQICEDGETEKCVAPNSREQHNGEKDKSPKAHGMKTDQDKKGFDENKTYENKGVSLNKNKDETQPKKQGKDQEKNSKNEILSKGETGLFFNGENRNTENEAKNFVGIIDIVAEQQIDGVKSGKIRCEYSLRVYFKANEDDEFHLIKYHEFPVYNDENGDIKFKDISLSDLNGEEERSVKDGTYMIKIRQEKISENQNGNVSPDDIKNIVPCKDVYTIKFKVENGYGVGGLEEYLNNDFNNPLPGGNVYVFNMKKKPENQDPPQEPPQNPSQPDNVQNKKKDPDAKPVVKEPKRKDIPDKKVIPQKVAKKVLRSLKPDNNEVPKVSKEDAKKIAKKPVRKEQTVISEDNEEYPAIDAPGKGLIAVVALITSVLIGAAIVSVKNNF